MHLIPRAQYDLRYAPPLATEVAARSQHYGDYIAITDADLALLRPVMRSTEGATPTPRPGLGDLVHAALKPFVRASDAYLGTNLANCEGCKKRREALNRLTQ